MSNPAKQAYLIESKRNKKNTCHFNIMLKPAINVAHRQSFTSLFSVFKCESAPSFMRHSRGHKSHCTRPPSKECQYLVGTILLGPKVLEASKVLGSIVSLILSLSSFYIIKLISPQRVRQWKAQ